MRLLNQSQIIEKPKPKLLIIEGIRDASEISSAIKVVVVVEHDDCLGHLVENFSDKHTFIYL